MQEETFRDTASRPMQNIASKQKNDEVSPIDSQARFSKINLQSSERSSPSELQSHQGGNTSGINIKVRKIQDNFSSNSEKDLAMGFVNFL